MYIQTKLSPKARWHLVLCFPNSRTYTKGRCSASKFRLSIGGLAGSGSSAGTASQQGTLHYYNLVITWKYELWELSESMEFFYVHAACPCPCCIHVHAVSVSMLHVNIHAAYPCPCCMMDTDINTERGMDMEINTDMDTDMDTDTPMDMVTGMDIEVCVIIKCRGITCVMTS